MTADNSVIYASLEWEGRTIRLSYHPRRWDTIDHLEIESEGRAPLPITGTGYKSHFFGPVTPALEKDDVVNMVRDWLDEAAQSDSWIRSEADRAQLSLF